MLNPVLFLLCGFVLLGVGAEVLVSGSSRLAVRLGVAPLIVGLTIVAFGTSSPELAVSIQAATQGRSELALGNVIGSNIANIGLVLGITAMIFPINIERNLVRKEIPLMIASAFLMALLLLDGQIGFSDGLILTSGLLGFLVLSYKQAGEEFDVAELSFDTSKAKQAMGETSLNLLFIVAGLTLLVFGSYVFVDNAVTLAHMFGISEAVIGLTVVAIGTSVPELATSVVAAFRKQSDIAIGNIIGSNLFNILCILGITSIISTIYARSISFIDIGIMILFSVALLPFGWTSLTLSRFEGFLLLISYFAYITYVVW